jgi:uncharacterized protein (DUF3084 family)
MTPELEQLKEQLAALFVETAGSLHTQIQETERCLRTEMQQGFERLDARLGRHGGLIQGGAKAIARLTEWSERVDEMIHVRDQEIAEIRERLKRLENGG